MKRSITYFEEPGPQNTEAVIAVVKERIAEGDIQSIVVASESGKTALGVAEAVREVGVQVVCVAPYGGYQYVLKRTYPPMEKTVRDELDRLGVEVLDKTPWIFGCTFDTAFLGEYAPGTIIHKFVSRAFGFGVKTCIEVALLAVEAGALGCDEEVITVAGTGWQGGGADAAMVVKPAPVCGGAFLKIEGGMEVREILAIPRIKFSERLIEEIKKAGKDEPSCI